MKRLFLLRHAKSSWDDSDLDDHDRPLAPRGESALKLMAEHLRRKSVTPALVLCSSARRTQETFERIAPALGEGVAVQIERGLYGASEQGLLERLQAVDDDVDSLMLIGHNPGVAQLACSLAGHGRNLADLRGKYPTGALATLEFSGRWGDLQPGRAELTDYVTPKQLSKR